MIEVETIPFSGIETETENDAAIYYFKLEGGIGKTGVNQKKCP